MAGRKRKRNTGGTSSWMTTYTDMVTLLLCFFVMLYASASFGKGGETMRAISSSFSSGRLSAGVSNESGISLGSLIGSGILNMPVRQISSYDSRAAHERGQQELQELADQFRLNFAEEIIASDENIQVGVGENYVVINFSDGILFDKGKADLKDSAVSVLDIIAGKLEEYPGTEIQIEGHTDTDPISTIRFIDNLDLSQARAASVLRYFRDIKEIEPQRMSAQGRGEYWPVAPNDTEENKTKNRRVEIKVIGSIYSQIG